MNLQLIICLKTVKAQLNKLSANIKTNINHRSVRTITMTAVCLLYCFH